MRPIFTLLFLLLYNLSFSQTKQVLDSLTKVLDAVYAMDQIPRIQLDSIQKQHGYNSDQVKAQWKLIAKNDSANVQIVSSIIEKYGWLNANKTSKIANTALFLVIQHADIDIQVKYIDTLMHAVEDGNAKASQYSYLLDRVKMRQGKLQIYGSQISIGTNGKSYFYPIKDEVYVNKRRKSIGLSTIEEYAKEFGIIYNLPIGNRIRNKLVVTGFVIDANQIPINEVNIKFGSTVVATSNADGFYIASIKRALLKKQLTFNKSGYIISDPPLDDEGKEVYELNIILTKK